ncbi:DEAD/DEAH box helicase [Seongchinamella sediminis]|uniref:ATP-dependent RNA helicase DeaD n=1 Tax=Seongchinamella sediminis TaxID=2283635 RepID=A0A3L7E4M2_9GAMM|nr:DEAD/DEAH box helicase [Seongchinamella sediminis]RLQ23432.1 DEAD/DEAH box helicase [Seongchinamella sediminis]
MSTQPAVSSFAELDLPEFLQKALSDVGYETPSAIQGATIPALLAGRDVLGQAQTGTGKTAAFALPVLAQLEPAGKKPQVLVLTPTRELAIQVAEAFQKYARYLQGFHVLPVYGGADYRGQLRQLQRGVQVVVGTPGRVMDHMRRGSLDLSALRTLVLDEADEMLRMGFIDDVEWILEQTPEQRQVALFSATMPAAIGRIAQQHLNDPVNVAIEVQTVTNQSIRQRVWMMAGVHKLDALTRILEVEEFDGVIIFVRTRIATTELAEKLAARGYSTAALNGDIPQKQREMTVENLKRGKIDILVATDVAARGLDVERISHVINYDIPYDVEAYVHRIGRTGRAGRKGDAILFAANRERRLLRAIEKATGSIEKMALPSAAEVTDKRIGKFKQRITETLDTAELDLFRTMIEDYQSEYGVPVVEIAAALAAMAQGKKPLVDKPGREVAANNAPGREHQRREKQARDGGGAPGKNTGGGRDKGGELPAPAKGMERFRIEVGHEHGVKPGNIVGAIANEAEIDAEYIGRIDIYQDHSTVDLPDGMPKEVFEHLKSVWVSGQKLKISRPGATPRSRPRRKGPPGKRSGGKGGAKHSR